MSKAGLKKPLLMLNRIIGSSQPHQKDGKVKLGDTDGLEYEKSQKKLAHVYERKSKRESAQTARKSLQSQRKSEQEAARQNEPPEIASRYGSLDFEAVPSTEALSVVSQKPIGETVELTARIHHVRNLSAKLAFVLLRQRMDTIQGVLSVRPNEVSETFVRWVEHLNSECLVRIKGVLRAPPEPVKGCSIHDKEILIESLHVLVSVDEPLSIDVYGMDRVEEDEETHQKHLAVSNRVRTANRILYLRTPVMQSTFRIRSEICTAFRLSLLNQDFIEIQTPKLQAGATESGSSVFSVKYFNRTAFLAQSPQLAKQMAVSSDFQRVFEVGPVFRAEDSNTHRHLTEYTGLDLEMQLSQDYHEAMDIIDEMLKSIFSRVYSKCRKELEFVKERFPHEDLVWLDKTPRLSFKEGIALLNAAGWTDEDGKPATEDEDLATRAEIRLGQLVKEKYNTDYFILDKFPTSARPFYTHLDPDDEKFTNSFDIFLRGQEITTGGQRINDPVLLAERMKKAGVDPDTMEEYMQAFEWGAPPHAGCGIGLERIVFLLLNLGDIRNATLFPRDPKSLPDKKLANAEKLPYPEADTILYAFEGDHSHVRLPELSKLIANYGDATNTSWLDDRYRVWRDPKTAAAVGYAVENGYALVMGNPLCDSRQYPLIISQFLKFLKKEEDLRPLWLLVSAEVEEILGAKLGWRTMTCVGEERLDVRDAKQLTKKERQAKNAGLKFHETKVGEAVPEDVIKRCDERIADWSESRKGKKQAHITEVRPWVAMEFRRYFWAEDSEGKIVALVVLHQLSPQHGYQIKWGLNFPGSPSGSIEALISRAIQSLTTSGVDQVTFGVGAMEDLSMGHNLNGVKARMLGRTYKAVAQQLRLLAKSEFREKFGAYHDPVYICYPFMGLGVSGARTLIEFFEDEM